MTKDHVSEYATLIADGKILANKKTIQAAQRHLSDVKRSKNKEYPYYFDVKKANDVIDFIQMLPDTSSGKPLQLVNFQKFIVGSIFGWRNKKTGFRRYNKAVISMGRKQGKSLIVAGIALYMLLYEAVPAFDRQIYTAANTRQQAKLVYQMIVSQLKKVRANSKYIRKLTKILREEIRYEGADSYIRPLSADYNSLDGLNVLLGILDEQSNSTDDGMVNVLESSQGQQDQPLILIISTVSEKVNAWFYTKEYAYVTRLLDGEIENDQYFCVWYEQESEEELNDPKNWIKSNPILYDADIRPKLLKFISGRYKEGQDKDDLRDVYIKQFNMWQSESSESYLRVTDWKTTELKIEPDLYGKPVYIGLDLARVGDLSAVSWLVPLEEENKFYVDSHSFVGTRGGIENKINRDKIRYDQLQKRGFTTFSRKETGNIDDDQIIKYVEDLIAKYNFDVQLIAYDRYSANSIVNTFADRFVMVDVAQGFPTLSEPTKQFRKYVQDGNIVHTNNPILEIAINNAILKQNNDAVQIDKAIYRNKIDPLAALINAWTQGMLYDFKHTHRADNDYYENEFTF